MKFQSNFERVHITLSTFSVQEQVNNKITAPVKRYTAHFSTLSKTLKLLKKSKEEEEEEKSRMM